MTDQDCLRRFAAHIDWLDILRTIEQATSGISSDEVIKDSIETRRALIQAIEGRGRLSQQAEATLFPIIEDFIEHDHHHEQQIDTFLHRSGQERPS